MRGSSTTNECQNVTLRTFASDAFASASASASAWCKGRGLWRDRGMTSLLARAAPYYQGWGRCPSTAPFDAHFLLQTSISHSSFPPHQKFDHIKDQSLDGGFRRIWVWKDFWKNFPNQFFDKLHSYQCSCHLFFTYSQITWERLEVVDENIITVWIWPSH